MDFCSIDTSGNPRASALDSKTVNKGRSLRILSILFFISDSRKHPALLLCVDLIQLYFPLEFAVEMCGLYVTCGKGLKHRTENPKIYGIMEVWVHDFSFSVQTIAFGPQKHHPW